MEKRTFSAFILTQVSLCTIGRHDPYGKVIWHILEPYEFHIFYNGNCSIPSIHGNNPCSSMEFVDSLYRKNEPTLFNRVYVGSLYRKNEPTRIPSVSLKFSINDRKKLLIQSCLGISPYFPICNPAYQFFYK